VNLLGQIEQLWTDETDLVVFGKGQIKELRIRKGKIVFCAPQDGGIAIQGGIIEHATVMTRFSNQAISVGAWRDDGLEYVPTR
jgi:prolipoprotein diacylglyceryltransferase